MNTFVDLCAALAFFSCYRVLHAGVILAFGMGRREHVHLGGRVMLGGQT